MVRIFPTRRLTLRRLRNIRSRSGRGYHEIVRQRRRRQARRGRIRRTCIRLTYQIPISILFALGFVVIIIHSGDRRILHPEEIATAGFGYNLTSFEVANLPAKWAHRIYSALPWTDIDSDTRNVHLERYPDLARELRRARDGLKLALAQNDDAAASIHQTHIDNLIAERNRIRDAVEELLEAAISTELINLGLHQDGQFIWPPVDFRIDDTPHVLVTSPRDKIERNSIRLLQPDLTEQEKLQMETALLERTDLSTVVLPTGGLASYPNLVPSDYSLQSLLEVSAHEWLHAYLIFHPLGRAYWSNGDMTSLNETLANLFGKEIGRTVYNQLTGENIPTLEPPYTPDEEARDSCPLRRRRNGARCERSPNDQTTRAGDAQGWRLRRPNSTPANSSTKPATKPKNSYPNGKIPEAEAYMESRRQTLVENGHNIRKINQAYFAFHGTYADSPSSTSPLARQIYQLRLISPNAGHLVKTLQSINRLQRPSKPS